MGEQIKIFISANLNDLSTEKNELCFNNFLKLLEIFFQRFCNKELIYSTSYQDNKKVQIENADAVLTLISEKYTEVEQLDAFTKELTEKVEKSKIFKILLSDIPKNNQPVELQALVNYYFYFFDSDENRIIDFFELPEKNNTLFNTKIINLAYDIYHLYNKQNQQIEPDPLKNVYLALTGADQFNNRELIKRELKNKGFNVLPEELQLDDVENLEKNILDAISKSNLSIHILSEDNHDLPGKSKSLIEIQNSLSIDHYNKLSQFNIGQKDTLFSRIIWLPPDLHITDEAQQIWLDNFIQSAESQVGAELIETPIETLKTIIDEKLGKKESTTTQMLKGAVTSSNKTYVLFEYKNKDNVDTVLETLKKLQQNPIITPFDKNYLAVIDKHRQNLVEADHILLLYINDNPEWLTSKVMDIRKSPGFGRRKSFKNIIIIHNNNLEEVDLSEIDYRKVELDGNIEEALAEVYNNQEGKK